MFLHVTCAQVVHYNVPPSVDAYVHRSGRTARAAAEGVSLCLIGDITNAPLLCAEITEFRTRRIPPVADDHTSAELECRIAQSASGTE
jgi:superfamily II DNA/RNA helicase